MTINGTKVATGRLLPRPLPREKLCVALDMSNLDEAVNLVNQLRPHVGCFKIGPALGFHNGLEWTVRSIQEALDGSKCRLFLDFKFHDIPVTVGAAVREAAALGVDMMTVHAAGGAEMLKAAVMNRGKSEIIAVTVLSSISDNRCRELFHHTRGYVVRQLAREAEDTGCQGIVCAPADLTLPLHCDLPRIVPGIRPHGTRIEGDDQANSVELVRRGESVHFQSNTISPGQAVLRGAGLLVVGRPITQSPRPQQAARDILIDIMDTLQAEEDRKKAAAAARKAKAAGQPPPTKP